MGIRLLDEQTINQIAAGEVVESPTSLLKELVENAIDAGARTIRVEAKAGGFQRLCVIDDGCGMTFTDLQMCLLRHATSKIESIHDLEKIATLGFRGEALASIAAVSRLRIVTKCAQEPQAHELISDGSGPVRVQPAARAQGTTVEVNDLFYNVPARKAFQKSAAASGAELSRWIGYLALAYPHVGFSYVYNGKEQQISRPAREEVENLWELDQLRSISAQVMGDSFTDQAYCIEQKRQNWFLRGLLGHPLDHRPTRISQIWIVNGRIVQVPQLSRGVQEGYGTRLPAGRFAQFVLHLSLPGEWLDVNVHPQKRELRFKDAGLISGWLAHVVNLALTRSSQGTNAKSIPTNEAISNVQEYSTTTLEPSLPWLSAADESSELKVETFESKNLPWQNFKPNELVPEQGRKSTFSSSAAKLSVQESARYLSSSEPENVRESKSVFPSTLSKFSNQETTQSQRIPSNSKLDFDLYLKPIAVYKRWSLWNVEDLASRLEGWSHTMDAKYARAELAWMSNTRALSRIRYEQAIQRQPQVLSQALLIPVYVSMHLGQAEKLELAWSWLHDCGFELTTMDNLKLAVHAIPAGMSQDNLGDFFHQLLDSLQGSAQEMTRERIALGIAKQMEHHANQVGLSPSELVLGLSTCHEKFFSPTGRAIFRPLLEDDLEVKGRSVGGRDELR